MGKLGAARISVSVVLTAYTARPRIPDLVHLAVCLFDPKLSLVGYLSRLTTEGWPG